MKIAKRLAILLVLALIPSWGAGYATEDRSKLNLFEWLDEFTGMCNYIGFNTAWMYEPGGKDGNHYFTLYIAPMGEKEDYEFLVTFSIKGMPSPGEVTFYCEYDAAEAQNAAYIEKVMVLYFVMAQMTAATEEPKGVNNIETLLEEGTKCLLGIFHRSPEGYYIYESAAKVLLKIYGYEFAPEERLIVLTMQYTGLGNLPTPGPDGEVRIPRSSPTPDNQ